MALASGRNIEKEMEKKAHPKCFLTAAIYIHIQISKTKIKKKNGEKIELNPSHAFAMASIWIDRHIDQHTISWILMLALILISLLQLKVENHIKGGYIISRSRNT